MKTLISLFALSACLFGNVFSQEPGNLAEQKLENVAEAGENEETDYARFLETLDHFREHPLNLNRAEADELLTFGLLDDILIKNLLDHKEKNGNLLCIYELQTIEGFDLAVIEKILPYIKVEDNTGQAELTFRKAILEGKHELTFRCSRVIEKEKGFTSADPAAICKNPNSRYIGSPEKIYTRYRFRSGSSISAGVTAEKDPGELFLKRNQRFKYPAYDSALLGKQKNGFDFYSAHLFLSNIKFIRALAIGDFRIGSGQGLVSSSAPGYSLTSDAVNIKKNASGIQPHTSADENRFMRGIAITTGTRQLQVTGFVSRKKIDAYSHSSGNAPLISSLPATGLHSTPSEIAGKRAVAQTVFGGNTAFRKRNFSIGLTGTHVVLSNGVAKEGPAYGQFNFSGQHLSNIGTDYTFILHNLNFFGEISASGNSALAWLNGCIASLDPRLSFALLHRHYQRGYQSLFANSFSQNTTTGNEQGIYFGITARPASPLVVNAYYDRAVFPWLKYQTNGPSESHEFLIQVNYAPSKKFETYIRFRQKRKWANSDEPGEEIDFLSPSGQINCRWNLSYRVSSSLQLRNRVEILSLKNEASVSEAGYLASQDVIWSPASRHLLSISARYALFDTRSYNSRVYIYEADVSGVYSIPSYYYRGCRIYAVAHYRINRKIEAWLRWSQTYYSNRNIISPGSLSEINGNKKNEIKVQVKLYFQAR